MTHDKRVRAVGQQGLELRCGPRGEVSLKDFRKDIIVEIYNEAGQLATRLQGLPLLGLRVPGDTRTRRERKRRRDPDPQAGERGMGTRLRGERTGREELYRACVTMRYFSAHDLLKVWETGEDQHPVDRALTLLSFACADRTRDELAALSVGQRDGYLLDLRERLLGPELNARSRCPKCAEHLEFAVTVGDLRVTEPDVGEHAQKFTENGFEFLFRLPNSRDLAAVVGCRKPAMARSLLARRCVLRASRDGTTVDVEELPAEAIGGLARRMAEGDPQAEVLLDLRCPACDHGWRAPFDILDYLWTELSARAKKLLYEVDALARAYGWSEADILEMSVRRRRSYLMMVS